MLCGRTMRPLLLVSLALVACSAPGGGGPSAASDCDTECASLAATCPGKVSNASCLGSCERAFEFVWAA